MAMRSPASLVAPLLLVASLAGCAGTYSTYGYGVGTGVATPPPLYAPAPQELVVLPGTDIYAAPSFTGGLYFVDGWWWRPWNGRWYRTTRYGTDWRYHAGTPYFYRSIPRDWRSDYYRHQWRGRPWSYHRVSRDAVVSNWDRWKRDGRWTRQRYETLDRDDRHRYGGERDERHRYERDARSRYEGDRGDRYRYDHDDFRQAPARPGPVRYERRNEPTRSGYDVRPSYEDRREDVRERRLWEPEPAEVRGRQRPTVIRRVEQPVRPVPASQQQPSGRGVRRGHDPGRGDQEVDEGYEDWRRR